ncbi:hypothetical protein R1sor_026396 [Riccia sorocarpa]|uniref:Uncharacterized protein n=1 Tax=Riccia sorocarpa TaxID=122646 RepID=A0ABD3GBW7_9MARC
MVVLNLVSFTNKWNGTLNVVNTNNQNDNFEVSNGNTATGPLWLGGDKDHSTEVYFHGTWPNGAQTWPDGDFLFRMWHNEYTDYHNKDRYFLVMNSFRQNGEEDAGDGRSYEVAGSSSFSMVFTSLDFTVRVDDVFHNPFDEDFRQKTFTRYVMYGDIVDGDSHSPFFEPNMQSLLWRCLSFGFLLHSAGVAMVERVGLPFSAGNRSDLWVHVLLI